MQKFLASDVVYSQRVVPLIKQALDDNDISGPDDRRRAFLPNLAGSTRAPSRRGSAARAAAAARSSWRPARTATA